MGLVVTVNDNRKRFPLNHWCKPYTVCAVTDDAVRVVWCGEERDEPRLLRRLLMMLPSNATLPDIQRAAQLAHEVNCEVPTFASSAQLKALAEQWHARLEELR